MLLKWPPRQCGTLTLDNKSQTADCLRFKLLYVSCAKEPMIVNRRDTTFRRKLATFLVVLYAFCVLAPHAAMALVHSSNLTHCLTETANAPHQHAAKAVHVHDDGAVHEHGQAKAHQASKADEPSKVQEPSKANEPHVACCGLFFMSALTADAAPLLMAISSGTAIASVAAKHLTDHPPGRINEPPIA